MAGDVLVTLVTPKLSSRQALDRLNQQTSQAVVGWHASKTFHSMTFFFFF